MTKQARSSSATPWWRGAAIYQIYPRSFADSNGDGIGDLPGITARLDYVAALGVDAIWLSPFFRSPMADFGYDVSDYCDVDPIFGTLADFDALVARAHGLGLKVLIDQVYAHTSDAHSWFAQSRADRSNPFADWYVWADAKPDGSPPNNWQAVFGGAAWTWDARRQQYYCHNFYASQPQLNVHHAPVQAALLDVARFWLDRGVDGFRLDAINFAMHDPQLRDNPPMPEGEGQRTRPFDFQLHIHNQSHPDVPHFLEDIRALANGYGDVFTVAEVGGPLAPQEMRDYTQGNTRLSSAYSFAFLYAEALTPQLVKAALAAWPDEPGMGWPSWAFSNHDAPRWISRWAPKGHEAAYARLVMLLFVCLRGNIIIWQGEELGLPQVDIGFEDLQDREAIANWPLTLSRDGSRTPMPWQADALHCGFSSHKPWLPIGPDHPERAVDRQAADGSSMLSFTRALMQWRKDNAALRAGTIRVLKAAGDLLVIERAIGGERLICAFNLGLEACDWAAPKGDWQMEQGAGEATPTRLAALSGTVLKAAAA